MLTSKQKPENPSADFAFDWVEAVVARLFVHAEGDGNVRSFAEGGMLRCVVALTEVVDAVARGRLE
jgi:hypothetical protein